MSGYKRFFVLPEQVTGNCAILTGQEYNHVVNVMRMREGDHAILCTGDGYDRLGTLRKVCKEGATFDIDDVYFNERELKVVLTAYVGMLKNEHIEFDVQKLSELGVSRLIPFISQHTVANEKSVKMERLQKIAIESAKQCGRARILEIGEPITIDEVGNQLVAYDLSLLAYEFEQGASLKEGLCLSTLPKNMCFIVGSEGGFSENEAEYLTQCGAKSISLGKRILRAETAAIALASYLMLEFE